ncbi:hypothetical protein R4L22_05980 [Brachyspira pilosicoli]|uniref:alginate O-acetyltransferase AlgX-related protein n=1 Tax=Brachyspira pilosicoli TaxID=52584 RepID=UPI0030070B5F
MKNIKLFNKILLSIGIIFITVILILFVLGSFNRIGYLSEFKINIDNTLKLNGFNLESIKESFTIDNVLDEISITNYLATNIYITNYSYDFRIKYYSKIFRNSDIYGVYLNTTSLPDYIRDIQFDKKGSPFGILISSTKIENNIDNIKYSLKLKFSNLFLYLILFYLFIILVYIFRKILFNIIYYILFLLKKYRKLLLIYLIIYVSLIISLFILGNINREGYLSNLSINIDDTLKLNNIDIEDTKELFYLDSKLDYLALTNYIFTNNNISKYIYNFRISYYSKIFRNSDIYGVYLNTTSLPDYIKDIQFDKKGSPFGIFSADKKILENIDNVKYSLKPKFTFLFIILVLFIVSIIFIEFFIKFYNLYKKINYKYSYILIVFLCFLIMPNIIYKVFYDKFDHTNYENRSFSAIPKFNIRNLDKYPREYETYFNDYIPFRNELNQLKNIIDIFIFHYIFNDKVILGKDNWLFIRDNILMDKYLGLNKEYYTNEELEKIKDNLISLRDKLKDNDIDFLLMVCNDKQFIYDEYMPDYIKRKNTLSPTDQILGYITNNTDIKVLYTKDNLLKYKYKYQSYYKYDTHWNYIGGYITYIDMKRILNIDYNDITNTQILTFKGIHENNYKYGVYHDLAYMLGLSKFNFYNDDNFYVISNYMKEKYYITNYENAFTFETKSTNIIYNDKLFIIRDSYVHNMVEYISSDFYNVFYYRFEDFESKSSQILKERPDIVIVEIVERALKDRLLYYLPKWKIE